MLTENSLLRKVNFRDALYMKKLFQATTEAEMLKIVQMLDNPKITIKERMEVELFLLKIRPQFDSWYETVLGLIENFDIEVMPLLRNTYILEKLRAEKIPCQKLEIFDE